jgi:hypothetical protein
VNVREDAPPDVRTVDIQPPSFRRETLIVGQLALVVIVGVTLYLANTAWSSDAASRGSDLMPYQVLVGDRPAPDQRMFRELQEGLLEAERIRASSGGWPAPAALAAQAIPPFAPDPTRAVSHTWTVTQHGAFVDYLGKPAVTGVPAWLLLVQEPEPGAPPDPAKEDEEHHRLPDGTMLHVSIWTHADGLALPDRFISLPQVEGWTQLRVGPPQIVAGGSR